MSRGRILDWTEDRITQAYLDNYGRCFCERCGDEFNPDDVPNDCDYCPICKEEIDQ